MSKEIVFIFQKNTIFHMFSNKSLTSGALVLVISSQMIILL